MGKRYVLLDVGIQIVNFKSSAKGAADLVTWFDASSNNNKRRVIKTFRNDRGVLPIDSLLITF